MNSSFLQRASNKNSQKLRLKSAENFSRGTRQLKFSVLRKIILEFVWELLTFFVTFLGQASCEANMKAIKIKKLLNKKVKKFKIPPVFSFANNLIYSKFFLDGEKSV